ncbi:MAG: uL15 family ribosomal protein [Candidatus Pacebacteria bacterium]|nr:uL15 family ribosomal protein [Candidatus Paceibacterota bacterium]
MQLNELKPIHKARKSKRVGRGGKRGTFSGKGVKGQKSRAGRKMQPSMREAIKRFHKLRGYRQNLIAKREVAISLDVLEKNFQSGEKVTPAVLVAKRIIRNINGKLPSVKVLAKGKLTKKISIEGCRVSQAAKSAIEKAGSSLSLKVKN